MTPSIYHTSMGLPSRSIALAICLIIGTAVDVSATDIKIIKKALKQEVMVGELVQFEIVADNTSGTGGGPLSAQSVSFTDQLPAELEFVSADGASCSVDGENKVTCQVGAMAAGTKKTVTITVRALATGTVVNNAQIKTELFDPDPNNNQDSATITIVPAIGERTISGGVLEDVNYAGGPGRRMGVPRPGATVELYDGSGAYLTSMMTSSNGSYAFEMLPSGSYTVRVVNGTVTSSRSGASGKHDIAEGEPIPVQTWRTDASSGSPVPVPNKVGGEAPIKVDFGVNPGGLTLSALTTSTTTAQSISPVTVGATDVINVDFVYNFDTIVNTNASQQGSLDQFIINANALANTGLAQEGLPAGIETSIFVIPPANDPLGRPADPRFEGSVFVIRETDGTPAVTDAVSINGHTERVLGDFRGDGPDIVLDGMGSELKGGLVFNVDGCHMTGMTIRNFQGHGLQSVGTINLGTPAETQRTVELVKNGMDGAHVENLVYRGETRIWVTENGGDGIEATGNITLDVASSIDNGGWGIITSAGNVMFVPDDFHANQVDENGLGGISAVAGSLTGSRITCNKNGGSATAESDGHGVIAKTVDVRNLDTSENKRDGMHADQIRVTIDPEGGANAYDNGGHGIYASGSIFLDRVQARMNGKWGVFSESGSVTGPSGPFGNFVDKNKLGGISARQGTVSGEVFHADGNGSEASGEFEGHGIIAKVIDVKGSGASDNKGHGFTAQTITHRELYDGDNIAARKNGKSGLHATGDITVTGIEASGNGEWGAYSETGTFRKTKRRHGSEIRGNGSGGVSAPAGFASVEYLLVSANGRDASGPGILGKIVFARNVGVYRNGGDGVVGETVTVQNGGVGRNSGWGIVVKGGGLNVRGTVIRGNNKGGILRAAAPSGSTRSSPGISTISANPAMLSNTTVEPSLIDYSDISSNEGVGLSVETGDSIEVTRSNLFDNTGFSIENGGAGTVMAEDNWWGDPAGPGSIIAGDVTADSWLEEAIGVVAFPEEDEHIAIAGAVDSLLISINNFVDRSGEVEITKADSLGWIVTDEVITLQLNDSLATSYQIEYLVPAGLSNGTENEIRVRVVSKTDPANEMTAVYRVQVATPVSAEQKDLPDDRAFDDGGWAQVYPNPVRSAATVKIQLLSEGVAKLEIFDTLGRSAGVVFERSLTAGFHELAMPLPGLAAGAYLLRIGAGGRVETMVVFVGR